MKIVFAIAGVVIKELYRRKDFYVLFVMTALITMILGSVRFFNDDHIVRYLKDACLLLIWISSLVIAITTAARGEDPGRAGKPDDIPVAGQAGGKSAIDRGKICGLLAGLRTGVDRVLFLLLASLAHRGNIPGR